MEDREVVAAEILNEEGVLKIRKAEVVLPVPMKPENAPASAMAAAGVVQLLGGNVKQGFMAASLALQNMLGLVCDPVGGLTEIPCISRNINAMSNAVHSANMVMMGFDPVIPLDETILSMYEVGQMLPSELRCTCKGGLCNTKTAKCIVKNLKR